MGVASIRARTARQAEQSIRTQQIHIAVVDLGLPLDASSACSSHRHSEEGGARILDMLRRLETPPPTVVVKSTRFTRDAHRDLAAALRSDAFAVVDRTSADVELMLKVLQRCMERFYQGRWPGMHAGSTPCSGPTRSIAHPANAPERGQSGNMNGGGGGGAGGSHRLMRLFGLDFV